MKREWALFDSATGREVDPEEYGVRLPVHRGHARVPLVPRDARLPGTSNAGSYEAIIAAIVALVVSLAVAVLMPRPNIAGQGAQAIKRPKTSEGDPIPVIFGTVWVRDASVLWFGDVKTEPVYRKGGKK